MAAHHRAIGKSLDQVERSLTIAPFHQSFIGHHHLVESRRQWFERLHAADVGTGQENWLGSPCHQWMESFAHRHGLSASLSRQRTQLIVTVPAGTFTSLRVTDEIQRRFLRHVLTITVKASRLPSA